MDRNLRTQIIDRRNVSQAAQCAGPCHSEREQLTATAKAIIHALPLRAKLIDSKNDKSYACCKAWAFGGSSQHHCIPHFTSLQCIGPNPHRTLAGPSARAAQRLFARALVLIVAEPPYRCTRCAARSSGEGRRAVALAAATRGQQLRRVAAGA